MRQRFCRFCGKALKVKWLTVQVHTELTDEARDSFCNPACILAFLGPTGMGYEPAPALEADKGRGA